MKIRHYFLSILLLSVVLFFPGCVPVDRPDPIQPPEEESGGVETGNYETGEDGHPVGWEDDSHGKKAEPNYDLLFNSNEVLRLDIVITPSDWEAMMDDMADQFGYFGAFGGSISPSFHNPLEFWDFTGDRNPIYVPCDLSFQGKTWHNVGIRFKGNSSLYYTWKKGSYKMSLRLTFDKFEDDYPEIKNQRFYGFKKLGLANNYLDDSLVREKVTSEIFRAAGIPVGRDAFCRVFINYGEGNKYFGLYALQEIPDSPMLKEVYGDNDGNLYKPDGSAASFSTWDPKDFDKETNEKEADFSDVRELYDILHSDRSDEAAFREKLESVFNVDGFLHYLAVNQVICNWDTYGNTPHNYFLYHNPKDDLLHWIPWDFNYALETIGLMAIHSIELGPHEVHKNWPLIRYLLDIPDYHSKYVFYVKKTIDEIFYPSRMEEILDEAYDQVRPYVIGENGESPPFSNLTRPSDFNRAFNVLRMHMTRRFNAAEQFLEKYKDELNGTSDDASEDVNDSDEAPSAD